MLKEKEYTGQGYYLIYTENEEGIVITGFRGRAFQMEVPERIEDKPVTGIGRKAFLSRKTLREIVLPGTVREIGDWAFAYCGNLEKITLPGTAVTMGRAVFLECEKLECISCGTAVGESEYTLLGRLTEPENDWESEKSLPELETGWDIGTGHLLAAAVKTLDADYLLDTAAAGSEEWLQKWDARLLTVMEEDDLEGYQKQILCGEEDYGSTDVNAFLRSKRMKKVRLAMLRLLNPHRLSEENRRYLEAYLREHTKGCTSEETWQVLLQEYNHDTVRIQLFLDLGCADEENMEAMLNDMGEEQPEMKAIFLRYQDTNIGYQDFFADLLL